MTLERYWTVLYPQNKFLATALGGSLDESEQICQQRVELRRDVGV